MAISTAEVAKLRKMTGAGITDCKKALEEANGDYEQAIAIIRKKGQLVAAKRADREANQGYVIAKLTGDATKGVLTALCCETESVAREAGFIKFTEDITEASMQSGATNIDAVKALIVNGITVDEGVNEKRAVIGEKIDLTFFECLEAPEVVAYIHPGNKLACLVGFNKKLADPQVGRDIAMQTAAMAPVAVDKESVPADFIVKELEIATDQAKNDPKNANKSDEMIEMIAKGKLEKIFKEMTLLNQDFIKDGKLKVADYLKAADKDLQVTKFVRFAFSS